MFSWRYFSYRYIRNMPRPTKPRNKVKVPVSAGVLPNIVEEIDRMSLQLDRSRSFLIEKLLIRGLAAYERDGLLDEPEIAAARSQLNGVEKERPKSLKRGGERGRAVG
jgi:hypothetical protein